MKIYFKICPVFAGVLLAFNTNAATVYDKDGTMLDIFGHFSALGMTDKASRVIKSATKKNNSDNTLQMAVNFGISGKTKINDTVSAIAVSEWQMPTGNNGTEKVKARYQYVGVDAQQFGTLTFGRGDNAFYTVAGVTDIFEELDMRVNDHYSLGDQMPGIAMYSISAMGWDVRASFGLAQDDINSTGVDFTNSAALSVATRTQSGISVAYGISYYDLKSGTSSTTRNFYQGHINRMYGEDDGSTYGLMNTPSWKVDKGISVSYGSTDSGFYTAVNYTRTKYSEYAHHLNSFEAVASYAFENGITLSAGYGLKRFNDVNIISDLTLGAYYQVIPNFMVFAEACFDINSKPSEYYTDKQIKELALDKNKALIGAVYTY